MPLKRREPDAESAPMPLDTAAPAKKKKVKGLKRVREAGGPADRPLKRKKRPVGADAAGAETKAQGNEDGGPKKKKKKLAVKKAAVAQDRTNEGADSKAEAAKPKKGKGPKAPKGDGPEVAAAPAPASNGTPADAKPRARAGAVPDADEETCELKLMNCPTWISDKDIYTLYESLGPMTGPDKCITRIKWRMRYGTFLRVGYVRFKTPELARRALAVEIPEIKGKTMTAAPLRTAGFVDSKSRQLFLRGWPRHVTNEQVYARYAHLGPTAIAGIHWLPGRGMRSCCFLTFDSKDNRDKALAGGGFQFDDATVLVEKPANTVPVEDRARAEAEEKSRELFLEPVYKELTNDLLQRHYQGLGDDAIVQIRRHDKKAWVVFRTARLTERARFEVAAPENPGKGRVRVKINKPRAASAPPRAGRRAA